MAATTETLKLARVAGMGYAEAADAMTVAIRSFKMEMSDAAVVTDVYSKVAAVHRDDRGLAQCRKDLGDPLRSTVAGNVGRGPCRRPLYCQ